MTTRCGSSPKPRRTLKAPALRHENHVRTLAVGQAHFAWKLYQACRSQQAPDDNLCFSPMLVHHVLTMGYMGARYGSAALLRDVLHLTEMENDAAINLAYADVTKSVWSATVPGLLATNGGVDDDKLESQPPHLQRLHVATRLYVPITHCLLDQYVASVQQQYGSSVAKVPFHTDRERARREINQWVEEATDQTVRELVKPAALGTSSFVSVVLASAVSLKASWCKQFASGKAKLAPFYPGPDDAAAVNVMTFVAEGPFRHGTIDDAGCRVVQLPFADDRFSMMLLLPNDVGADALDRLEEKLSGDMLSHLHDYLPLRTKVKVTLPRFRVEDNVSLAKVLAAAPFGLAQVFVRGMADLSGISGNNNLHLSHVEHKVCLELEHFRRTQAPPKNAKPPPPPINGAKMDKSKLEFNRPFVYLVHDQHLGMFLLLGSVRKLTPDTAV